MMMTVEEIVITFVYVNVHPITRMAIMHYKLRNKAHKVHILMISIAMLTLFFNGTIALGSGESAMNTAKEATNGLPPIDKAAPSAFETASFGLG